MGQASAAVSHRREEELYPKMKLVHDDIVDWASRSTNGALVWQLADEEVPAFWDAFRRAIGSENWWHAPEVQRELDNLAGKINDRIVHAKIEAAKKALQDYND